MMIFLAFQVAMMMACLFLAFNLASEAGTAFNDVTFWRQSAIRQGAHRDPYSQAGMFRAYRHASEAYDRAYTSLVMVVLTGLAGLSVAFLG
jgi:ATP-dependent helicase YprA (DUF1998 family)